MSGEEDRQPVGDETVVAPRGTVDETVVVARSSSNHEQVGFDETIATDGTIVFARPADDIGGETVVAAPKRRRDLRQPTTKPVPVAPALNGSESGFGSQSQYSLDSRRRISAVPGATPWDEAPAGERGVSQGIPVSYGARAEGFQEPLQGIDEVQRRIGPAPVANYVAVREGREGLPSMARRSSRERVTTLALYAGVVAVSLLGLWGIAKLAFGW